MQPHPVPNPPTNGGVTNKALIECAFQTHRSEGPTLVPDAAYLTADEKQQS